MTRQVSRLLNGIDCLRPTASLSQARQGHAYILKIGLSSETHFATKLLKLYANHQCFSEAKVVLDSVLQPDVISFSTLIHSSSKCNRFADVLCLLSRMVSKGLVPDHSVLPSVLKACTGLSDLKFGKQVHGYASISGLASDSILQSSLVRMYVKCNQLTCAHKLLDAMPEPNVISCSTLIAGYARQGYVTKAKQAFDEMRNLGIEPNTISWSGMIAGFNQSGNYSDAVSTFQNMHFQGFKPDGPSISSVLPAAGDLEDLKIGFQIHGYVIKLGVGPDICVVTALIDMYGKCACASEMSQVFDQMEQMDLAACNALIAGLSRNGLTDEALRIFKQFQGQGMDLNVVSWTSMIACCSQHGNDIEALELFREMQMAGVKPNAVTIPCLLPACGNIAALTNGKAIHCFSIRRGISSDVYVGSALIDMYANCGRIQAARLCFDWMPTRNLVCWNAMMSGYAMHGKAKEAIEIFHLMLRNEEKPDLISFTCILFACSQNGLMKEGQHYFYSMSSDYGMEARVEHYACMVTLLGRAGKLEEAFSMIKEMPFEPDACVWGALLSSCRVHNNMILGEVAAKKLFELEPRNPGNYILLSNIYASKGKWNEVNRTRDMLKSMGLRKNPGCSWIEVKNKTYMLLAGDKTHPQMAQILEKLEKLYVEMRKSGYLPIIDFVLQDVDEQDKEHILCGHSEKLAVVFGLLNTTLGSPLRVIKNLRICGDCHAVIKFISRFEGREIYVRDTKLFHHFKDGECSCGDYW